MFRIEEIKDNHDFVIFFKIIEKKYINNFIDDMVLVWRPEFGRHTGIHLRD